MTAINNKTSVAKKSENLATKHDKRAYGTGRRKSSIARVWISLGNGNFTVNKKPVNEYFTRELLIKNATNPLQLTSNPSLYDVFCTVKGGGCSGQAGAILHGLARAIDKLTPDLHVELRKAGFLTRDSRVVERKKYGRHKARKSTQFSKR